MIDFIVNPASGSGAAKKAAAAAESELIKRGVPYAFHLTNKAGDAAVIAGECIANGTDAVAIIGGDGSVQEVAGTMARTGVPLGIVPAGSGNDLIASLYDYKGFDPVYFVEKIIGGETRCIDVIKCTVANDIYHFVNIGSVGLDAEIVHKADDFKKVFRRFAYIVSTVYNAFTYKPGRLSVESDALNYDGNLSLTAICNGGVYGGGFKIAPSAVVDDGFITLCVVKPLSKLKILMLFPSVLSGKHTELKEIDFYDIKKVTINYDGIIKVNLDGNIFDYKGPAVFEIEPGALKIFK